MAFYMGMPFLAERIALFEKWNIAWRVLMSSDWPVNTYADPKKLACITHAGMESRKQQSWADPKPVVIPILGQEG